MTPDEERSAAIEDVASDLKVMNRIIADSRTLAEKAVKAISKPRARRMAGSLWTLIEHLMTQSVINQMHVKIVAKQLNILCLDVNSARARADQPRPSDN